MKANNVDLFLLEMSRRLLMSQNNSRFFKNIINIYNSFVNDMVIIRPTSHKIMSLDYVDKKDKIIRYLAKMDINCWFCKFYWWIR